MFSSHSCILYLVVLVYINTIAKGQLLQTEDYEQIFLKVPDPQQAREHLQYYTSLPHSAGTDNDYATAQWTLEKFQSFGLNAEIQSTNVLLAYPVSSSLQIVAPPESVYNATLQEDIVPEDPTSDTWWRNHTFHGYGPSGDVEGELVYANYGTIEDFQYLVDNGIELGGKIAIVRYGNIFRGLKVMHAQNYSMLGVIIYSDPFDDGYARGQTYPDGPWRPPSGIQRGSVQFNSLCTGDPGMISRQKGICGNLDTADLIPSIPVIPINYRDATPLLSALTGTLRSPASWHGALNVSYDIGPGPAVVHLTVQNSFKVGPIWNVISVIPGTDPTVANETIVIGNHRDAWVYGAADPNSGTSALIELARGLGQILSLGWTPRRTIILCSWDGEEYGLLGSTNYGETNQQFLQQNAITYINVDVGVQGPSYFVSASPPLHQFIYTITQNITDPNTGKTIFDVWDKKISRLGSGSDFTVFVDYLGISSIDMTFSGEYGVYHSVFDSFTWMSKFGDPQFLYHQTMAQLWGLMVIRLADSRILPYNITTYGDEVTIYVQEAKDLAAAKQMDLEWSYIDETLHDFRSSCISIDSYRVYISNNMSVPTQIVNEMNARLSHLDRVFLSDDGLPGRTWFKHLLIAPGLNTGYSADVLPSLKQAIRNGDPITAQQQIYQIGLNLEKAHYFLSAPFQHV